MRDSTRRWPVARPSAAVSKPSAPKAARILLGPGGFQPHPPRTGGDLIDSYPWHLASTKPTV